MIVVLTSVQRPLWPWAYDSCAYICIEIAMMLVTC